MRENLTKRTLLNGRLIRVPGYKSGRKSTDALSATNAVRHSEYGLFYKVFEVSLPCPELPQLDQQPQKKIVCIRHHILWYGMEARHISSLRPAVARTVPSPDAEAIMIASRDFEWN
jgi:hypothetical protein